MTQAKYIEVAADVRYWEDTLINGDEDTDGTLVPCRKGSAWAPVIRLEDGQVMDWQEGKEADVHYKVCDAGEYWLQNADRERFAKWRGYYVPNDILCVGDNGYGDYIIMHIGADGKVKDWQAPAIAASEWNTTLD